MTPKRRAAINLSWFFICLCFSKSLLIKDLKTGVKNSMFWSEIGTGFGEPGGTPLPFGPVWSVQCLLRSFNRSKIYIVPKNFIDVCIGILPSFIHVNSVHFRTLWLPYVHFH